MSLYSVLAQLCDNKIKKEFFKLSLAFLGTLLFIHFFWFKVVGYVDLNLNHISVIIILALIFIHWYLTSENLFYLSVLKELNLFYKSVEGETKEFNEKILQNVGLYMPKVDKEKIEKSEAHFNHCLENVSDAIQDGIERIRGRINTCLILGLFGTIFGLAEAAMANKTEILDLAGVVQKLPFIFMVTGSGALSAVISTLFFLNDSIRFSEQIENVYKEKIINLRGEDKESEINKFSERIQKAVDSLLINFKVLFEQNSQSLSTEILTVIKDFTNEFKENANLLFNQINEDLTKLGEKIKQDMTIAEEVKKDIGDLGKCFQNAFNALYDELLNEQNALIKQIKEMSNQIKQETYKWAVDFSENVNDINAEIKGFKSIMDELVGKQKEVAQSINDIFEKYKKTLIDINNNIEACSLNAESYLKKIDMSVDDAENIKESFKIIKRETELVKEDIEEAIKKRNDFFDSINVKYENIFQVLTTSASVSETLNNKIQLLIDVPNSFNKMLYINQKLMDINLDVLGGLLKITEGINEVPEKDLTNKKHITKYINDNVDKKSSQNSVDNNSVNLYENGRTEEESIIISDKSSEQFIDEEELEEFSKPTKENK